MSKFINTFISAVTDGESQDLVAKVNDFHVVLTTDKQNRQFSPTMKDKVFIGWLSLMSVWKATQPSFAASVLRCLGRQVDLGTEIWLRKSPLCAKVWP